MISALLSTLNDQGLLAVLQEHIKDVETPTLKERFESSVKNLQNPRYVIPVLGVQGSGKSSLLNAILLQDIVLPVDADETTCIPTEIIYADLDTPQADVVYKDGRIEQVECSEKGLKKFVHQEFNPSNEKNVSHISIAMRHPLLKTGIVLVDLPGVGSITESNRNTTMNYIKQSAGAIFLLRTVPPITHSESIFIQGAWPLMSNTFFVQNQWSEEPWHEVEDGRDHSTNVLRKIAATCRISAENLHIGVVGVAQALTAIVRRDHVALEKTGLPQFIAELNTFANDWKQTISRQVKGNLLELINGCRKYIYIRIEEIGKSNEDRLKDLETSKQLFRKEFREKEALIDSCLQDLQTRKSELNKYITEICRTATEDFRNDMREVINNGVTGGEALNKAFADHRNEHLDNIFEKIQPEFINLIDNIKESLGEIGEFSFKKNDNVFTKGANVNSQSTVHEFYKPAGSVGGTALGTWGGIVAGAKIGTLLGTSLGPGWGNAIGFIAGAAIGLLGGLLGSKLGESSQQFHLNMQKEAAREQIFKIVDDFGTQVSNSYKNQFKEFYSGLGSSINTWLSSQKKEFASREEQIMHDAAKSELEKQQLIATLTKDINKLDKNLNVLNN